MAPVDQSKNVGSSAKPKVRKRAMSMASGMSKKPLQLSPKSKRRSLGPPKGILKSRINQLEDASNGPSFTTDFTLHNMQNLLVDAKSQDNDTTRKSLSSFSRRVSFAPTANVRTFNAARDGNTNSTESPSSPATSETGTPSPGKTMDPSEGSPLKANPRLSTLSLDGEQSMELDEDESFEQTTPLDSTELFGHGIFARRSSTTTHPDPSASDNKADTSRRSTLVSEANDEAIPIGMPLRPSRPPSQAYLDLQDMVSQAFSGRPSEPPSGTLEEPTDPSADATLSDTSINVEETIDFRTTRFSLAANNSEALLERSKPTSSIRTSGGGNVDMSISQMSGDMTALMDISLLQGGETSFEATGMSPLYISPSSARREAQERQGPLSPLPNPIPARTGHHSPQIEGGKNGTMSWDAVDATPKATAGRRPGSNSADSNGRNQLVPAVATHEVGEVVQPGSFVATSRMMPSPSPARAGRVRRSSVLPSPFFTSNDVTSRDSIAEEPSAISLEAFFAMTGVRFMDEITCPRKSVARTSSSGIRRESGEAESDMGPGSFFLACNVYIPQLQIYSWVASELRRWIEETKTIQRTAEEEVTKVTPAQFTAYAEASEEDRVEFTGFLKLVKACEQLRARLTWYHWKYDWVVQSEDGVEKALEALRLDLRLLEHTRNASSTVLAQLRDYQQHILAELAREEQVVFEIEQSNPAILAALKDTITEQKGLLEEYQSRALESRATLGSLEERLSHLEEQRSENRKSIESIRRRAVVQVGSTKSGVLQLEEVLEYVKSIHMWTIGHIDDRSLQLNYGTTFSAEIPCARGGRVAQHSVLRLPHQGQENFDCLAILPAFMAQLTEGVAATALPRGASCDQIAGLLNDCWVSLSQVEAQLALVAARFPLALSTTPNDDLEVIITILFDRHQSKAQLVLRFSKEVLVNWPSRIKELGLGLNVLYGKVAVDSVKKAVENRLSRVTVAQCHACLLEACFLAMAC